MNAPAKKCEVIVRDVYGIPKVYPVNDVANLFAEIAGKKTMSAADLKRIEALGFEVVQIVRPVLGVA